MRIEAKPPTIPLFALVPVYMGNSWVWGERIDMVFSMMMGIPYVSFRLPPAA